MDPWGEPVTGHDDFRRRLSSGTQVEFHDVHRLGRYASHLTVEGRLYEYDQGTFWHTDLNDSRPKREQVDDERVLPPGPWFHHPICNCGRCRSAF